MKKGLKVTCLIIEILLFFLVEDALLWLTPAFLHTALLPRQARMIESRCSEVKVGMSQAHVMNAMQAGKAGEYEFEVAQMQGPTPILRFGGEAGVCEMEMDPVTGSVTSVRYQRFESEP
jgi:hypothetical protein